MKRIGVICFAICFTSVMIGRGAQETFLDVVEANMNKNKVSTIKELLKAVIAIRAFPEYKKEVQQKIVDLLSAKIKRVALIVKSLKDTSAMMAEEKMVFGKDIDFIKGLILYFTKMIIRLKDEKRRLVRALTPEEAEVEEVSFEQVDIAS